MPDLVHVHSTGEMVNRLLEVDMEMYGPCVTWENGEKVLYVELLKVLHGTVKATHLFWEWKHLIDE